MTKLNMANRTLAIMDNYLFPRSLNNECVDLIAIDPPFAANETFTSKPRPPISKAEFDEEAALAKAQGQLTMKASARPGSKTTGLGTTTFILNGRCGFRMTTRKSMR